MGLQLCSVQLSSCKCRALMRLTESSLSEQRHSSGIASEPRRTRRASSGTPPSPGESAAKTARHSKQGSQFNKPINLHHKAGTLTLWKSFLILNVFLASLVF